MIHDLLREESVVHIGHAGRNSTFKLAQAPFGGGRTLFLDCLRETRWTEDFVTGLIEVCGGTGATP